MFEKLILAFAPRAARSSAVPRSGGVMLTAARAGAGPTDGDPGSGLTAKDPEQPILSLTLVERCRLRVDPLNANRGRVPCGPFAWKWEQPIGKLDVSADTTSAWFYPVALGLCAVTVSGAGREAVLTIQVIAAVPETLNLLADPPEIFRDLAAVDTAAAGVL